MGAVVVAPGCCYTEAPPEGGLPILNQERGLGPQQLFSTAMCAEEQLVELDFDDSVMAASRPRTKEAAAVRRQLLRAARADDGATALRLVADGADFRDVAEALRLASYRGSTSVVRELVAAGIGPNEACPDAGLTSLQLAAGNGHALVCELLLDAMADPDPKPGPSAFSLAQKKGHEEVQEVLERHFANMELLAKGEEPEDGHGRGYVMPRVSLALSQAVIQMLPAEATPPANFQAQPTVSPPASEPDAAAGSRSLHSGL